MEKPILIASDGTSGSAGAIGIGTALAKSRGQPVEILVVQEPLPLHAFEDMAAVPDGYPLLQSLHAEDLRKSVQRQVDELCSDKNLPIAVEVGAPPVSIVRRARDIGASLIVMGAGPHFAMDRWLRSEAGLKVVRLAHVPVLLVPQLTRTLPRCALVAVDFSRFSVAAAHGAASLLPEDGRLHLTHVMWSPVEGDAFPGLDDYWKTYKAGAISRLEKLAAEIAEANHLKVEVSVIDGEPARETIALADRLGADIIAAGSHGYGYLGRIMMGSVSTRLIRGARGPVLIVPPDSVPAELTKAEGKAPAVEVPIGISA